MLYKYALFCNIAYILVSDMSSGGYHDCKGNLPDSNRFWNSQREMEASDFAGAASGPDALQSVAASIGTISYKVLTQQLRELEEDGLVCRKVYPEVPPRVEYALSEMGESIFVVFREMRRWALDCDPVHQPVCSHCSKCRGQEETES